MVLPFFPRLLLRLLNQSYKRKHPLHSKKLVPYEAKLKVLKARKAKSKGQEQARKLMYVVKLSPVPFPYLPHKDLEYWLSLIGYEELKRAKLIKVMDNRVDQVKAIQDVDDPHKNSDKLFYFDPYTCSPYIQSTFYEKVKLFLKEVKEEAALTKLLPPPQEEDVDKVIPVTEETEETMHQNKPDSTEPKLNEAAIVEYDPYLEMAQPEYNTPLENEIWCECFHPKGFNKIDPLKAYMYQHDLDFSYKVDHGKKYKDFVETYCVDLTHTNLCQKYETNLWDAIIARELRERLTESDSEMEYVASNDDHTQCISQTEDDDHTEHITQAEDGDHIQHITQAEDGDHIQHITQAEAGDYTEYITQTEDDEHIENISEKEYDEWEEILQKVLRKFLYPDNEEEDVSLPRLKFYHPEPLFYYTEPGEAFPPRRCGSGYDGHTLSKYVRKICEIYDDLEKNHESIDLSRDCDSDEITREIETFTMNDTAKEKLTTEDQLKQELFQRQQNLVFCKLFAGNITEAMDHLRICFHLHGASKQLMYELKQCVHPHFHKRIEIEWTNSKKEKETEQYENENENEDLDVD